MEHMKHQKQIGKLMIAFFRLDQLQLHNEASGFLLLHDIAIPFASFKQQTR